MGRGHLTHDSTPSPSEPNLILQPSGRLAVMQGPSLCPSWRLLQDTPSQPRPRSIPSPLALRPGRPGVVHACLYACAQTPLFHLAVRKGDSRLELEPTGASLLGNASSSPPGSCLAWQGPSWQAQQPRSPGGQGEGMVRGRQLPPQAQAPGAEPMAGLPAGQLQPPHSCFSSSLLCCPLRSTKGNSGDPPPPAPAKEKTCRRGAAIGNARNTLRERSANPEGLLRGVLGVL